MHYIESPNKVLKGDTCGGRGQHVVKGNFVSGVLGKDINHMREFGVIINQLPGRCKVIAKCLNSRHNGTHILIGSQLDVVQGLQQLNRIHLVGHMMCIFQSLQGITQIITSSDARMVILLGGRQKQILCQRPICLLRPIGHLIHPTISFNNILKSIKPLIPFVLGVQD